MTRLGTPLLLFLMLGLSSCSSISKLEKAVFRNSTLANLNPAPGSIAPPEVVGEAGTLDPLYVRSQADYHYALAEALSLEGGSDKAIEEFKLVLVYDPDSVTVRLRLAAEYVKQGLLSEAMEQAESATKMDPSSEDALMLLGGLYSSLRMYELAMEQYDKLLKVNPKQYEVYIYMGALLAEQKNFKKAEQYFRKLTKVKDYQEPHKAYYYIGRIRVEQGGKDNYKKAEKAYVRALESDPKYDDAIISLSELYKKQGKNGQSLKLLESFQDKFGPNFRVAKELSQIYLEKEEYDKAAKQLEYLEGFDSSNLSVKVKLALILIEGKKYEEAIQRLEEIIVIAPESDKIRFYLGAVHEELKDAEQARENFMKIPSTSSYFADAVIHSAYLYRNDDKLEEAAKVIKQGIKRRQDIAQFYAFYASLLDQQKKYKLAAEMLEDAVEKFPMHTQLRFFLGSMFDRIGKVKKTVVQMKKIIEIDKDHVQALNYLAYTYAELNEKLDVAQSMAERAMELQPEDAYILDTYGWVKFKRGELEDAIRYLEAAYKIKSTESIIAEHLGDAYYRHQLIDKAKLMYQRAVSIEQNISKIRKIKSKIVAIDHQKAELRQPASSQPASSQPASKKPTSNFK